MQCARCGAIYEGRFCPRCGATAMAAPPALTGWPCPRCGTLFRGNFCPRCGLPTAAWGYRPPPPPSGGRSVLSVLWTLALVGFIIFVITDFAALVAAPAFVVPGIQAIRSGQTVNSGLDFDAGNWTFNAWGTGSSSTYRSTGGFANRRLGGPTDAPGVRYVPPPAPIGVGFTLDQTLFITYVAFIAALILFAAGFHLVRERREIWPAFRAPLEAIGTRLKSRS